MDLFLFTSKGHHFDMETNPLVLKEAMSWQLPIMMYKLPSYLDKFDGKVTYLTEGDHSFEKNLLKISLALDMPDKFIKSWNNIETVDAGNPEYPTTKITLHSYSYFESLKGKLICLYDAETDLLIYRTNVFGPSIWFMPHANAETLDGLTVRIYDVEHTKYENLIEKNSLTQHNLLYEKKYDTIPTDHYKKQRRSVHVSNDDTSAWFTMYEVFVKDVYQDLKIKPNDIVLDVGAHVGMFSLYAQEKGAKQIYAFEPTPSTFKYTSKNLGKFKNVKTFNYAMSGHNGHIPFIIVGASTVCSSYENINNKQEVTGLVDNDTKKTIQIPCMNFHTFADNNEVDRIDVMKIDCEGGENDIFPTISDDYLKYRIRKLYMEVHNFLPEKEDNINFCLGMVNRLKSLGYEVTTKDGMMEGELGEMFAERMPKIKIVHMLVDVNGQREKESIKHLTKFAEETGWEYEQMINGAYTELPPKDTCARPDAVQMEPGEYKLAPAHYGNFLAHRTAIETHLTDEYDAVLLCECDAIFIKPLHDVRREVMDRFDDLMENNLNYMSFGKRIPDWHYDEYKHFGVTERMSEAHCYLIPTERREYFGETNLSCNKKIKGALDCGLIPIYCIGETLKQREARITLPLVEIQVREGLAGLSNEQAASIVIAYEPVWAIGTGKTATAEQAQEVHQSIRGILKKIFDGKTSKSIRIQYGGSVKPGNVDELMAMPDIDGALVGGASLDPESFARIVLYQNRQS